MEAASSKMNKGEIVTLSFPSGTVIAGIQFDGTLLRSY